MAYVVLAPCIDVKDGECINCALCVSVCPVEAIFDEDDVAESDRPFVAANRNFFGPEVTGWEAPGGYEPDITSPLDAPLVAAWPRNTA